jgi:zinc finger protein
VTPEQVAAEAAMVADDNMDVLHFPAKCSACGWPSETRMHILDIPYFKEVVIMSTVCESCGYKSNEVKAGGAVSDLGRRITLNITEVDDLSRDILKSETCGLSVPEIDLELMPGTLGGRFTTVEGLLQQVHDELQQRFEFNKGDSADTEGKTRFQTFLDNLAQLIQGTLHATLILDDPLANSYLQNLYAPDPDPNLTIIDYERTFDQNEDLGLNDMNV